MGEEERQIHR
jgi:hypothetical protein